MELAKRGWRAEQAQSAAWAGDHLFPNPEVLLQFREVFLKCVQRFSAQKAAGECWAACPPLIGGRIHELSATTQIR